jgi:LysR family cys regulon transcriptional activator
MNLTQLRYLRAIAEQGFNISRAAAVLHTSQPGISKQIQLLEREIGVDILVRRGNRVTGVSEPGRAILNVARRMLGDAEILRRIGEEFTQRKKRLVIATTHIYARYVLRSVIKDFIRLHPDVQLTLRQGNPAQIAQWIAAGEADIGVSSEPPEPMRALALLPCSSLQRSVITRSGHPLLKEKRLTLARLAQYPLLTLDQSFPGGAAVMQAFGNAGIEPNIVLSAIDADVIKTYVELGLGVAILPSIAHEPARDRRLKAIDASHLFAPTITHIAIRRDSYLRGYMYDFILMIAPNWGREAIGRLVKTTGGNAATA